MRYRQFSNSELEHRLQQKIADQVSRHLETDRINSSLLRQGVERGRAKYVAMLMPAKRSALRNLALQNAKAAEEFQDETKSPA